MREPAPQPGVEMTEPSSNEPDGAVGLGRHWWFRWRMVARRHGLERKAALLLIALAVATGVGTYVSFAQSGAEGPDPLLILGLLYLNLVLLLLLGAMVAQRLVRIWVERRRGLAGSGLHVQLTVLFGAVAIAPTIMIAVFSIVLFDFGIRSWFSERVATAVDASQAVASAYLDEHRQTIRGDVLAMANDLNREASLLAASGEHFAKVVSAQAAVRNLVEAVVFDDTGRVFARTGLSFAFDFEPIPESAMRKARDGEVVVLTTGVDDRMRALIRLDQFSNAYLYVGRFVDPAILGYIDRATEASEQYQAIEGRRFDFQLSFALLFAVVALLLLLVAVWVGLTLATRLVQPISDLIAAAERVSGGDLDARVPMSAELDELGMLGRAFNRMTQQLAHQRDDLMDANSQIDERRRFTEAVLGGVSAGVIGLDEHARINLPNRTASRLLGVDLDAAMDRPLAEVVPAMAELVETARKRPRQVSERQIELQRDHQRISVFSRITVEWDESRITGYVVTFDDITDLLSAQRKAAWSDIARRIAHEIKNPLTPIQLSAERLRRKYLKQIDNDQDVFEGLTDTIVRQVGDIGRMVDEFSDFARMPAPVFADEDVCVLVRQQIALQQTAHPEIKLTLDLPDHPVDLICDSRLVRQALTNLLQNAVDAIQGGDEQATDGGAGEIGLKVMSSGDEVVVEVADNGSGLPDGLRHRLTEPYVTTREKGTGLGLAIVTKIMEDHAGRLELLDREHGGARARLIFAAPESGAGTAGAPNETNTKKAVADGA